MEKTQKGSLFGDRTYVDIYTFIRLKLHNGEHDSTMKDNWKNEARKINHHNTCESTQRCGMK
jgi:hypothetical protein